MNEVKNLGYDRRALLQKEETCRAKTLWNVKVL